MYKKFIVNPLIKTKSSDLIEQPVVVHVQKFEDDAVKEFRIQMELAENNPQPVIPILIDSYGGSVYGCLNMIGIIEASSKPVHTIVIGKAMSAGATLFAMGQNRYMAENATLMLHDVSSFTFGKIEEMKSDAQEADRLNKLIFKKLANNCGHKDDYFLDLIHQKGHADWYLTPKECKKHKLCTHIGIPEMKIKVDLSYEFG
jgi:ATP-dependent protease ClpP protease subunit